MKFRFFCVTCGSEEEANKIGQELIKRKLVACANIIPEVKSIFSWQGKLEATKEVILLLKTSEKKVLEIELIIKKMHSYECPCIVSFDIKSINKDYENWIKGQLAE